MLIHLNLAALITFLGVASSIYAVVLSDQGKLALALVFLILAGLADLFDGFIARLSKPGDRAKALGSELDSLADIVSFGIAPVLIFYFAGILTSPIEWLSLGVYLFAAFQRLAHFNVTGLIKSKNRQFYTGLPVTYAALVLPLAFLLEHYIGFSFSSFYFQCVFYVLALLFISKIPIPKPGGASYLIFPAIAGFAITALILEG